ncbi:polyisoprenoid-binding protein [bacterium]|nr:polyisoprenoid-binding protein [bacterium]
MRSHLFAAVLAAAVFAPSALAQAPEAPPAGAYVLDKTHASINWRVKHLGVSNYTARFTHFNAELQFDPAAPEASRITVTIDPKTVETDFAKTRPEGNTTDFNAELQDERFFNSAAHPKITFVSTSATKTSDTSGALTGDLTFLGVTKPVTINVTYNGHRPNPRSQKHKLGFSGTTTIKRSEWGMSWGQQFLGDDVQILIEAEFEQK